MSNYDLVTKGFRTLVQVLAPFIARELKVAFKDSWWQDGVWDALYDEQRRGLNSLGTWEEKVDSLDIARCLVLIDIHWNTIFKKKMSIDQRNWAKELAGVRNKWAHIGSADFDDDYTWRAMDTMSRLCEQIDAQSAEEIREMLREARYGSAQGSVASSQQNAPAAPVKRPEGVLDKSPIQGLPSWRMVMEPHPDVAQGRYRNAEFAADLSQVARGEGAYEYRDPVEFFSRTYITEGMSGLLVQALRRISSKDGEPVIQLKTAFGGGKTHSMLALYHLMRGRVSMDKLPNVKPVLQAAGLSSLPRANVAVLVGTALDPSKSRRPNNFPGITINTLWGEMAAQLAESAGNSKLYEYVRDADRKGVSPGSEALKNLFDACAPCMVLVDELVAYAKKLYGVSGLPAGSFDNLITFIQEITEATRASKNSLVVASIPESNIELGGEAGQIALAAIEHTFGRMESIWKPVAANEGFEVVRRRLFLDCKDPASRELVCAKFSELYNENTSDFPNGTKEVEYKQRLLSCYPIHPEIFDRLYEDWATLERFQKTRGVLRLMATVVHDLWMGNDAGLLIMPGSISMDNPNVRDELTRHLPENWNALVDREVDGRMSIPYQKDQSTQRFGKLLASRRVARTIMLGSAPTVKEQSVRGIEASRIRLGVIQPGENIATFNDALNTLQTALAYLYTNPSNDRYWYDTRPTLRKTVEDRATQFSLDTVEHEIEQRIRKLHKEPPFAGLHPCPASSLDVTDEQAVRLVILRPSSTYKASQEQNAALKEAQDILDNRGTAPRSFRNMLAFVAPDQDILPNLMVTVRRYLAWKSIKNDSEVLNLDAAQNKETEHSLSRSDEMVDIQIRDTYCWLLVPYIDRDADLKTIIWDRSRISGGTDNIVTKAAKRLQQSEMLIVKWAPALLLMELDKLLWKESDSIAIKKLWEYLCSYCYLPRISSLSVLEDTIRNGLNSTEYFAYAEGVSDGRFLGLKYNQYVGFLEPFSYIVKLVAALKQIAESSNKSPVDAGSDGVAAGGQGQVAVPGTVGTQGGSTSFPAGNTTPATPQNTRFYLSATLDNTRVIRDVNKLLDEVINHIANLDGSTVEISLEVSASIPKGIPQNTLRTVSENCRTLKVDSFGFEE